jgi:hypothetical protein
VARTSFLRLLVPKDSKVAKSKKGGKEKIKMLNVSTSDTGTKNFKGSI